MARFFCVLVATAQAGISKWFSPKELFMDVAKPPFITANVVFEDGAKDASVDAAHDFVVAEHKHERALRQEMDELQRTATALLQEEVALLAESKEKADMEQAKLIHDFLLAQPAAPTPWEPRSLLETNKGVGKWFSWKELFMDVAKPPFMTLSVVEEDGQKTDAVNAMHDYIVKQHKELRKLYKDVDEAQITAPSFLQKDTKAGVAMKLSEKLRTEREGVLRAAGLL